MLTRRLISVASAASVKQAAGRAWTNGILVEDKFMQNGLPLSRFKLVEPLKSVIDRHRIESPGSLVSSYLTELTGEICKIAGSDLPFLRKIANHVFQVEGKHLRPMIVLLVSQALSTTVSPNQQKLSQITEMLHTASLLHDDVLDKAESRRGVSSVNSKFGNKAAILGGDFLLSRASVALARLRNVDVVELLATVIEHLVKGELLQTRNSIDNLSHLDLYLIKSFYKTASLVANSCKAAAILAEADPVLVEAAYEYGKHFGILFQIIDDILDFESTSSIMGKPTLSDLGNGIASVPVLFAAEEFPQLVPLIERKFEEPGDIEMTLELLRASDGIHRARRLAASHAEYAIASILQFPQSEAQSALITVIEQTLSRRK